jgi:serine/threonine-protein kinase
MGCVLFRMIAGRPPFVRMRAVDLLGAHILEPAPPPSSTAKQLIPPAADDLVLRALAKSPDERFQSADQMRLATRELLFALARSPRQPAKRSERPPSPAPAGTEPLPRGLPAQRAAPAAPPRLQARPTLPMPTKERPGPPPTLLDELEAPTLLRRPSPRPVDPMREHRVRAAVIGAAFGLLVLALILSVLAMARR